MNQSILIADDDASVLTALKLFLKTEGYEVTTVNSPSELILKLREKEFSVALIDMNYKRDTTSGIEGLDLIREIKSLDEFLPIVVMTGYSSVDLAVESIKLGASDFVKKPWKNDRLLSILKSQIRLKSREKKIQKLATQNELLKNDRSRLNSEFIIESTVMKSVLDKLVKLAKSDMNILVTGENGTGKSAFANYIHQCSSRNNNDFISVNMGAISENLFESEMFGHVKGAFTDAKENRVGRFELAEGGTIFLDEIANIPLSQQAKLLRVLEDLKLEKLGSSKTIKIDVRLISATNSTLSELIEEGKFRQDLLYRLNTFEIQIPPLRQRTDDIIPLANYFLKKYSDKYMQPNVTFSESALNSLTTYQWPGNVRELNHMIERALFLCQRGVIEVDDLGINVQEKTCLEKFDFSQATLDDIEKYVITRRLKQYGDCPQHTYNSLGLSRSSFYRRLVKHDLKHSHE